jgi:hypothetical protein
MLLAGLSLASFAVKKQVSTECCRLLALPKNQKGEAGSPLLLKFARLAGLRASLAIKVLTHSSAGQIPKRCGA